MSTIFTDDFNAYADGALNGQGGWFIAGGGADFVVEGTVVREGTKAIVSSGVGAGLRYVRKIGIPLGVGNIAFYVRLGSIPAVNSCFAGLGGPGGIHLAVSIYSDGIARAGIHQTDPELGAIIANVWYLFEIQWWIEAGYYVAKFRMNGGAWSDTVGADWAIGYDAPLESFGVGTWQSDFYVDYIAEVPIPIPAAPSALSATAISATEIDLTWTSNSGATELGFEIWRKTGVGGTYALINTVGTGMVSYNNTAGLSPGTLYYYKVRAISENGNSAYCTGANATTVPSAPTNPVAIPGIVSVGLAWDSMTGATSYNIYRSTIHGGGYSLVGNSITNSYIDGTVTPGTTYYYVIASVGVGGESDKSIEVNAIPVPSTPTGITATAGATNIGLGWNLVPGANRYNVYRSTIPGGGYTKIAWTITNGYIDNNIIIDIRYYYVVTAVEGLSESAYSPEVNAMVPLLPPTGLSAIAGSDYVLLSWNISLGADSYNIYRSVTSGGGYSRIGNSASTNHRDASLTPETKYYYVVTAVKGSDESAYSSEASAVPTSDIWLDPFNGDDKGSGSESDPIKTVARLLQMLEPGKTIYYVGIPMGQPGYIYQIADPTFWNLG